MGGPGYQPVPLGNLPSGRGEGIIGSTNVRLANEAFGLPPGWQPVPPIFRQVLTDHGRTARINSD